MMMYSSVLKQRMHYLIRGLIIQSQLLTVGEIWKRKILQLMSLMEKKRQGPRCQINHVNHPYIPGRTEVKPQHQPTSHIRRRRKREPRKKKKKKRSKLIGTSESPMIIDDDGQAEEKEIPKKRKGFSYYPLLTYKRDLDKTFYYKYFRPYSHDYRRLRMEEDCQCPQTEPHDTKCEWYDPNIIYILEAPDDISASEEAAQQKIYDLYMSSMNSSHQQTEYCGCVDQQLK